MESFDQLTYQDKITMIRNRYKSTKEIYLYMTERLGFYMPTLKNCRLKHIQDILTKKKKVLIQEKSLRRRSLLGRSSS